MGRARRLLSGAALLASAGGVAWASLPHPNAVELGFAAALAAASFGLTRRAVVTQILSRATAWLAFAPSAAIAIASAMAGHARLDAAALAMASAASLVLARPMLEAKEARAAFAPRRLRGAFLAASTLACSIGLTLAVVGVDRLFAAHAAIGLGLASLGGAILAAAIGVLRMRTWGILLSALASLVSITAAIAVGGAAGTALAWTALPGIGFLLVVALAKLGAGEARASAEPPVRARISVGEEPARARVAESLERSLEEPFVEATARRARA